jgi:hypothetical protein
MSATRLGRICHKCNTYCRGSDPCLCPPGPERRPTFQVSVFRPYTEKHAPGTPHFATKQDRDAYCAQNGYTYDQKSNAKFVPKPLMDEKLAESILARDAAGERVELPPPPPDMDMERVVRTE